MFDNVLVPLDGSSRGEAVLPWVRQLVAREQPRVFLLGVVPGLGPMRTTRKGELPPTPDPIAEEGLVHRVSDMRGYLDGVARHVGSAAIRAEVREGDPDWAVVAAVREYGIDLVVLAAGGESEQGGLAAFVARMAGAPVVLVGADAVDAAVAAPVAAVVTTGRVGARVAFDPL